jgi:hypothetical protein
MGVLDDKLNQLARSRHIKDYKECKGKEIKQIKRYSENIITVIFKDKSGITLAWGNHEDGIDVYQGIPDWKTYLNLGILDNDDVREAEAGEVR